MVLSPLRFFEFAGRRGASVDFEPGFGRNAGHPELNAPREVLDEIKSGNSALHDTLDENELLQTRVAELENEVSALEEQLAAAEADRDALRDSGDKQAALLTALDWLSELEHDYSAGSYSAARKTAQAGNLDELLFAMIVLGDDRLIEQTIVSQAK